MDMMKSCRVCREPKPLADFNSRPGSRDGLRGECRDCGARQRKALRDAQLPAARFEQPDLPHVERPAPAPRPEVEKLHPVEEHRLRRRVAELEAKTKTLIQELSEARAMEDLGRAAAAERGSVEPITPRERNSGLREGTALVLASDWHIEEEVRPETVADRNRYNVEISGKRMTRFFEAVRWAVDFNRQAFLIRDLVLWLGGDLITNYLHPDNVETNLLSPVQAIAYAQASIAAGIRYLLEDPKLERIVIPCNDGNHGRLSEKMRSAARIENSIEWLLYTMLAREFAGEKRVQFLIAEGSQLYYDVYGRTIRFTHGDTTKYGGGVGGITIPIYKALSRWDTVRRAHLTCMGHYHQFISLADLIINGSLIGYSPYSLSIGARYEAPSQAFTMLDPVRFKSVSMPLWVSEIADDQNR